MMSVRDDFTVDAGSTFVREFEYLTDEGTPIDISSFQARAQVRKSTFRELVFASIPVIDEETWVITMTWTAEQTELLKESNYVYGLEIYNDSTGEVYSLTHGAVMVNQEIVK
jgi:hypothetical protein